MIAEHSSGAPTRCAAVQTPDERHAAWATVLLPMVRRIAAGFSRRLPPSLAVDDLVGAGLVALVELRRRHPHMPLEELERLGAVRARGAMLDELRQADPLSRRVRQRAQQMDRVAAAVEARTGQSPSEQELATALGISDRAAIATRRLARSVARVEPHQPHRAACATVPSPEEATHVRQRLARCRDAIGRLPDRQRRVVDLYFHHDRNLRQIGEQLGVSEARASQILSGTVRTLRHSCASIMPPAA
jgi:RNA polymerase sigma factor for flagellar operon FliA